MQKGTGVEKGMPTHCLWRVQLTGLPPKPVVHVPMAVPYAVELQYVEGEQSSSRTQSPDDRAVGEGEASEGDKGVGG